MGLLDFGLGLLETAFDVAADFIPAGGAIKKGKKKLKKWAKLGKEGAKWAARGVGGIKDALAGGGMDFGDFALNVDNKIKDGMNQCKADIEAQGKALRGEMQGIKSELEGALKQQGEKFDQEIKAQDAKIAALSGEQRRQAEETKKALQKQKQQLEQAISEVEAKLTQAHQKLEREIEDFKNEVNERFEEHEKKILENKRRIEEERIKREQEIKDVQDRIKLTNTNLENLRQEKEEMADDFAKYKSQINQKTAETQQVLEDTQAEYQRQTSILNEKIKENEEIVEEFQEELTNTKNEQARQRIQQEEIMEELSEQSDILYFQKHKLEFVANQMEEIHEEVHERMDNIQKEHDKLEEKTNESLNIAKEATKKVNELSEQVKEISNKTFELEKQIQENKQETEKAKKEAKWANERLDNYIKAQKLLDFSAQQSQLSKIQKSLELKAEETKLLATLNFVRETKKMIPLEFSEREWKVGIKEGTEREMPRPEGMPLNPNSSWAKKYTPEQLREWGWDTRLLGENEAAPLTDPEKRKPEQTQPSSQQQQEQAEQLIEQKESKQSDNSLLEKFTELEKETIERLKTIQQEINQQLKETEEEKSPPVPKPSTQYDEKIASAQKKIAQLSVELERKEQETKQAQQKALNSPTAENKKSVQVSQTEQQQIERQLERAEAQLQTLENQQQFEEKMEEYEESITKEEKQEVEKEWTQIQALSQQVLEEQTEEEPEEILPEEKELDKKFEELVQQLNQQEQAQVSSQKTMSYFMLYLIIFLLEYIVYKRNGLPGLIVLNIFLLLIYQRKDQILEHYGHLYNYLLIIAYVVGNILIYNAIENPDYKWPAVIGYNLCLAGIYAYNYYQQHGINLKIAQTKQEIKQAEQKLVEKKIQLKEQKIKQLVEVREEAERLNEQLVQENLTNIQKDLAGIPSSMTWQKIIEKYPEFAHQSLLLKELEKAKRILKKEEIKQDKSILAKLTNIPIPSIEEQNLLSHLRLTVEQFTALSSQAQYLTNEEKEVLPKIYLTLSTQQKLQLLNSALNNLGINTQGKKQNFVALNHALYQESRNFGLSVPEKENILRLLVNTLNLTLEQRTALEEAGISFFDATNWQVSEEQKENLLSFGLNKIELTEEQQESLSNLHPDSLKTFAFTEEQKNILQSLAPLTQEYKYSAESLQLLKNLALKPKPLTFLVGEEILPNPNLDFGETKSPYLPLKVKFLAGEQTILRKQKEAETKKLSEAEIIESKNSILESLLEFWYRIKNMVEDSDVEEENQELHKKLYYENNEEEIDKSLRLTLDSYVKLDTLKGWQRDILLTLGLKTIPKYHFFELLIFACEITNKSFADFLEDDDLKDDYETYLEYQINQPITINKLIWEKFVSSQTSQQREIFANLNLEELIKQQIKNSLAEYKFSQETFYDSAEELETEEPQSSTSRYDNLFDNLNTEEAQRQKKKKEREKARKKLEEQERQRREQKLTEKDQKLKEDEERRQKEKELEAQETERKRAAEEARNKALQEEQESYLAEKLHNIEEKKKRAEQALENQKKANELQEKKKREEIEKLEKENQEEQKRLANQAKLIEEEKEKKLAAIALEDKEERQRIEKKMNEEKAKIEAEMNEKKRKNDEELEKQKNQLLKQKKDAEETTRKLQAEAELQRTLAEDAKRAAREQERILREAKGQANQLRAFRESLWRAVKDYYWNSEEAKSGTRNPTQYSGGYLRDWLSSYPNMQFNLNNGDIVSNVNWSSYRTAMQAFYRTAGNRFVNQHEFQRLLEEKVRSLDFLN